ncbi:non-ribosomal peptide synthetase [Calothrix sp. NIES-2098]|uniref:non-ribosomal peptide synthetase n=1 Tax=Calothrix sp. NIES-2098 TaxID=1954171 RepID=UPI000B5EB3A8|nr:amino acid adenylation domain-containing protein [Calothrix sp. NIES-2098]
MSIVNRNLESEQNIQSDTQILQQWYKTEIIQAQALCLHELFARQVEQTPNAVAVIFENQKLTYRELNNKSNQLANYLKKLGVGPEVLVGICLERSLEMVVGLLGILKAGAAYVPLDPAYPQERLNFILEDSQTPLILSVNSLANNLAKSQTKVVCLDSDWEIIAQNSQENPVTEVRVDNLSYVIYTSGSTGKPKGVAIAHRSICNTLYWRQNTFKLTPQDKVLQTISFSFDPSVWQIFWPLSFGAQLVMARPGGHQDPAYLIETIIEQQITVMALVPSMMRVLLEEEGIENCQSLRHITSGGEALPIDLVERFLACLKLNNILVNCYGPTEAAIDATFWICQGGSDRIFAPIGRPIANTQIYILDEDLQPVPVGEAGELYIGGVGLARGYLNRPELTKEKFIPNPFASEAGTRLYKTGDLARYLPDGNIEFLGRIDHQVKIRGFRIELAEVEAAIAQHPAVKQAIVIDREDVAKNKQLVAYIVPQPQQVPTKSELRSFLQGKLPDYMLPAAFVFLDALPLNPNGKIDRQALPAPASENSAVSIVLPRNQVEQQLLEIWQQVLGVQPIGVRDNFFELGGHSLLAIKLFWEIEQAFGKNLPLATLFQAGTIESLAKILQPQTALNASTPAAWSSLVPIQPQGNKPPFFCIHGLGGEVLCFRELAMHLGADRPFYGLQPQGLDDKQPFLTRIEDMAAHYIREIQTIQPQGPYFLGGYSIGGIIVFEMAHQLQHQGQEVALLAMLDSSIPGTEQRLPFVKRIVEHFNNLLQLGPAYLWDRAEVWRNWAWENFRKGRYLLQKRYKHSNNQRPYYLFDVAQYLLETDRHLEMMETSLEAVHKYNFKVYPEKIVLFRTDDRTRTVAVGVQYDPQFGWGELVAGTIDIYHIPGSHESLLKEPSVQVLAEKLRNCLAKSTEA